MFLLGTLLAAWSDSNSSACTCHSHEFSLQRITLILHSLFFLYSLKTIYVYNIWYNIAREREKEIYEFSKIFITVLYRRKLIILNTLAGEGNLFSSFFKLQDWNLVFGTKVYTPIFKSYRNIYEFISVVTFITGFWLFYCLSTFKTQSCNEW